jgi:exosortase
VVLFAPERDVVAKLLPCGGNTMQYRTSVLAGGMVEDTIRSFENGSPPAPGGEREIVDGSAGGTGGPAAANAPAPRRRARFGLADLLLLLGFLSLIGPTLVDVGKEMWSTEEGAHGPIILMTGIWLLWIKWPSVRDSVQPPPPWKAALVLAPLLILLPVVRIADLIEIEGYLMYLTVVAAAYALVGGAVLWKLAFPLVYLAFVFPPPTTLIYSLTMPLKVGISETAISLLQMFGYPIGGTGVMIQIGQYQLLVAAACSGLNSIVSLSALTIFYIYVRHSNNLRHASLLLLAVVPIAVAANFIRVIILILLTYHAGEATAQSFLHDLAGLTMFATALVLIYLTDLLLQKVLPRPSESSAS